MSFDGDMTMAKREEWMIVFQYSYNLMYKLGLLVNAMAIDGLSS